MSFAVLFFKGVNRKFVRFYCAEKVDVLIKDSLISVCIPGYYKSSLTCQPCLSSIYGSGGEVLIDGDTNTCAAVPVHKIEGAVPQYQLSINGNCTSNLSLMVTMESSGSCADLRSVLFTEKPRSGCNDVNNHFNVCDVTNEIQSGKQKGMFHEMQM